MKKRVLDLLIFCVCLAVIGIVLFYPEQVRGDKAILAIAAVAGVVFLILAVREKGERREAPGRPGGGIPSESELITEIILLSEEDNELMAWDLYGKTAMVIGRDVKENQVDINLGGSPYASMVEIEHAVLNFPQGTGMWRTWGAQTASVLKRRGTGEHISCPLIHPAGWNGETACT